MTSSKVTIRKLRNGKYQLTYLDPFYKRRVRKRAQSFQEAKEQEKQILNMFDNTTKEHLQALTINELLEMHIKLYPNTKVDERRIAYESFVENFGKIMIKDISPTVMKKWIDDLKIERDYAEITTAHIIGNLNHFFNFLIEEGIISRSPFYFYKINKSAPPKTPRVFYTQDEIKLILDKAKECSPNFLYPYLMVLAHTGVRRSEALELKWENVDLQKGIILFTDIKSGSRRSIKMSPPLQKTIEGLEHTSKYVLTNPSGEKIGRSQLFRHLVSLAYSSNLGKMIKCHAFRHSFAYNFLKKGGQMYELMAVLGHKHIGLTVNLYGQLKSEDVEDPSPYKF